MEHIVIIGNGIAGITAARHIRKLSNHKITVVSGESEHFFSRTALMYIYMGHMKYEHTKPYEDWFWKKNRIDLIHAWVKNVDFDKNSLFLENGDQISYDRLILATGSKPNAFGWKGQDLHGVQSLYSLQDLQLMEQTTENIKQAVVVGGGLIGVEMAEMLRSKDIEVTYLVREPHFWSNVLPKDESMIIDKHLREHHIELKTSTELKEIVDDGNGRVKEVITSSGESIPCQFVGLTVGVHPNVEFLKGEALSVDKGIVVDRYLKTNISNVYAIGDCAQIREPKQGRKPIEAVWYTGRMMGETVAQTICNKPTEYDPGLWFNSAKFFDIEYQVYGTVPNETTNFFYWQHENKAIRIAYDDNKIVLGANFLGIRQRHEVWDRWISEKKSLVYVMQQLRDANFDPELFTKYEDAIQTAYNNAYPADKVQKRKRHFLAKLLSR